MCVSGQAWCRLEQNNYLFDGGESNKWSTPPHSPSFSPSLQPESWQFTHQHVFHYPWQLAISLAVRKHTVNIHKVIQTPGRTHSRKLEHMQEHTYTHTQIHKHTLIEAHSRQFADRLSELCGIYWLLNFYSELNWMTTNSRSARLSYYPLRTQSVNLKAGAVWWNHSSLPLNMLLMKEVIWNNGQSELGGERSGEGETRGGRGGARD